MDVGELLRKARATAGLNQRVLAKRAGTSRSTISEYESGAVSPTVATLDRLLAACGLQVRGQLEPLMADVDARVDALLHAEPELDTGTLSTLARTLDDRPTAQDLRMFRRVAEHAAPVRWAFDGCTALQLHGLAAEGFATQLVAEWDDALRWWLRTAGAQSPAMEHSFLGADLEEARQGLSRATFTMLGWVTVRLVDELPAVLGLAVPWSDLPVPVVSVDEVERSYPEHEEVLRRWRARRAA